MVNPEAIFETLQQSDLAEQAARERQLAAEAASIEAKKAMAEGKAARIGAEFFALNDRNHKLSDRADALISLRSDVAVCLAHDRNHKLLHLSPWIMLSGSPDQQPDEQPGPSSAFGLIEKKSIKYTDGDEYLYPYKHNAYHNAYTEHELKIVKFDPATKEVVRKNPNIWTNNGISYMFRYSSAFEGAHQLEPSKILASERTYPISAHKELREDEDDHILAKSLGYRFENVSFSPLKAIVRGRRAAYRKKQAEKIENRLDSIDTTLTWFEESAKDPQLNPILSKFVDKS